MGINNSTIMLVYNQQSPYNLIYSLGLMELEILKAYIKNNLAYNFIKPSKSPTGGCYRANKKWVLFRHQGVE